MAALLQELVDAPSLSGGLRNGLLRRVSVDCNGRRAGVAYWYCVVHRPASAGVPDMLADYNRGWNECRQAMLSAAPTPAEAPAQDFEDALEQAFWDFDARHKGIKNYSPDF